MTAPSRRWPRFTLRTLFVVVTAAAILFGGLEWALDDERALDALVAKPTTAHRLQVMY